MYVFVRASSLESKMSYAYDTPPPASTQSFLTANQSPAEADIIKLQQELIFFIARKFHVTGNTKSRQIRPEFETFTTWRRHILQDLMSKDGTS